MDDENELENQSIDIPIWKRYLLSVTEAAWRWQKNNPNGYDD